MYGKAAVFKGAGVPVEIQEFPLPEVEPGAILVKTRMATICGSDIHRWLGKRPDQKFLPSVMGHEGMGEVYELGGGVTKDSIGKPLAQLATESYSATFKVAVVGAIIAS